jgi:peptidylprolyl isomerase
MNVARAGASVLRMNRLLLPLVALLLSSIPFLAACGDGPDAPVPTAAPSAPAVATKAPATAETGGSPIKLTNPTVTTTGLQYTDEKVGTGASPRQDQEVTVHYTGRLAANGQKFDSSVDRGTPATFPMTGVIKGFSEGLSTMKVGGKRTVYIPAALGYGATARTGIPANSDLVFEIELISIK